MSSTNEFDIVANDIFNVTTKQVKKSPKDESYSSVILGINQDFTDDVTEEEQQALINKYSIPEVPDKDNYYTFKINGNYYVKSSNTDFKLYEKVIIRVPNGSWDNMYIEIQRDTVNEGGGDIKWFVLEDEPEGDFTDGDMWIQLYKNSTLSIYAIHKWSDSENKWVMQSENYIAGIEESNAVILCRPPLYKNQIPSGFKDEYGKSSVSQGANSFAYGDYSNAECASRASGNYSHSEGSSLASGTYSHAEGQNTIASGTCSHAEGQESEASGLCSHSEGGSSASGVYSHAEGLSEALGGYSHAEGHATQAIGSYSHTGGSSCVAYTPYSFLHGRNLKSYCYDQVIFGKYNRYTDTWGELDYDFANSIVLGAGHSTNNNPDVTETDESKIYRRNAFYVNGATTAEAWIDGYFSSSYGDYSEYYEWQDGNPNNEDRAGLFVTVDGLQLKLANKDDVYLLGVVSATPSVIGNAYNDHWKGKYKKDIFGRIITDENGNRIISEDFDPTQKYIPYICRIEKEAIGTHGQLIVIDDGTCEVNGYCGVGENGIGTRCDDMEKVYRGLAFRVTERLDETHIRIVIK